MNDTAKKAGRKSLDAIVAVESKEARDIYREQLVAALAILEPDLQIEEFLANNLEAIRKYKSKGLKARTTRGARTGRSTSQKKRAVPLQQVER